MDTMTLTDLLGHSDSRDCAIVSDSDGDEISYRALVDQVEQLAETLQTTGLAPGDVVALVLPNCVELLILFLALARARLVAAPLNPAHKSAELHDLISAVDARAVIADARDGRTGEVAAALSVPVWTSSIDGSATVRLDGMRRGARGTFGVPGPDDVALVLQTSGTEGKPKVVPLTHAGVLLSARHIAAHYALTTDDRSLIVLPLFHGHGLIGAALAPLASGGTAIVSERFPASRFWNAFREHRATWFTAVPTIHQILLERADVDGAPRSGPRFIRSCSASLTPVLLAQLQQRFGAPVVEAYGMTEASHQVASNPLPPRERKAGTVGFGIGTEVAVIGVHGDHLPPGSAGEVVVRGPSVFRGYRGNAAANDQAFVDGWFRTGDIGVLDNQGYLSLTGRSKELINRGGEKISPAEIENVLLSHPAVAEAAVFGVPDAKYGEVVEAVVVLRRDVDPAALRAFTADRLADFEVPTLIHVTSSVPKNAVGKVQRRALAALYAPPGQHVKSDALVE